MSGLFFPNRLLVQFGQSIGLENWVGAFLERPTKIYRHSGVD